VDIQYVEGRDVRMIPEMVAKVIPRVLKETEGDVLVFLPGQAEIIKAEEQLKKKRLGVKICKLYGHLPFKLQQEAILPADQRKIVLSTSIAETSLTIEGITAVVDCGFARVQVYNPNTALSGLKTVEITKDSADQRAGRAGRLGPGKCYRLWSTAEQHRIIEHRTPEILSADLTPLTLELYKWGISDINSLSWLDFPPSGAVSQAEDLLESFGAIDQNKITAHGREIHQLPCHPRLANLLVKAQEMELESLATDLCAVLEERDPLPRNSGVDLALRVEALRRYRTNNGSGGLLGRIEKIASQYRKILDADIENGSVDDFELGLLVAQAYPERIGCARPGNNAQFQLANGQIAMIHHTDDLAHEPWIAAAHVDARDGKGKIFMASPLNPRDLASMVKQVDYVEWDEVDNEFRAEEQLKIGNIVLQSKPILDVDAELKQQAIAKAIQKRGKSLLTFSKEVMLFIDRVAFVRKSNPALKFPDYSQSALLSQNSNWITPYLDQINSAEDLKKLNLKEILFYSLSPEHQKLLDELAPEKIEVPSGSNISIDYDPKAPNPILAVRIQELFGLDKTPTINGGKTPLLIHLLSPGFKPVQVTQDLISFWENTYFEVRKELKRRYPKHHWPDEPMKEAPLRGVKRKSK